MDLINYKCTFILLTVVIRTLARTNRGLTEITTKALKFNIQELHFS